MCAMQVAHVLRKYNPAQWGGTETAVQRLCDGLRAHAVESVAFCPQLESDVLDDPLTRAGHRVKRFNACVPVWGISEENRRLLVAVGGNLLSFDLLWDLWREPLDIVHVHTQNRLGGIGLTVSRLRGVPLVAQIHGGALDLPAATREFLDAPRRGGVEWGKVFGAPLRSRKVLECADAVIACNRVEAQLLRERYPAQRVVVQPHGVPAGEYEKDSRPAARAAFPSIAGRAVLLMAGRIDAVKNQNWVVEQFPEIVRRHPETLLVIAGSITDPPYAEAMNQNIARLGLGRDVLLTGPAALGRFAADRLMQEARALVLPSVSETFGLVILEAWACGTPVISSRTSGALELVVDGENGCLFNLRNPAEFHAAVTGLLSFPEAAARMAQSGRELVKSKYDTVALAGRVKNLYEELIRGEAMKYVILRDDDTNALMPASCLERLYRPFLERGLPVNLAVIPNVSCHASYQPGQLERFLTLPHAPGTRHAPIGQNAALVSYLRDNPLFYVAQHGCSHESVNGRREFDHEDGAEIARRLDEGTELLRAAGFDRPTTFVAPYDQLSTASLRAAAERFRVISTGWFEWRRLPRAWWPQYLVKKMRRAAHWEVERVALLSHPGCRLSCHRRAEEILPDIQRCLERQRLTVLVTHWWEYFPDGREDAAFIGALHETAAHLASRRDVRVITFGDIANGNISLN